MAMHVIRRYGVSCFPCSGHHMVTLEILVYMTFNSCIVNMNSTLKEYKIIEIIFLFTFLSGVNICTKLVNSGVTTSVNVN
jgi:hypothetical protein